VSGGLTADDAQTPCPGPGAPCVEITPARHASIGDLEVDRALPSRARRTVGAWCFADHMLPTRSGLGIGPHPHIGLHTVTWLVEGEVLHKDSLGSEQPIRPGQLNLMTAGNGIAHAEEDAGSGGVTHGAQLWVAQPDATRHGAPAFEHHAELPRVDLAPGTGTVLVGSHGGATSPARADTPLVGLDLDLPDGAAPVLGLDPAFEHALVVLTGALEVDGRTVDLTAREFSMLETFMRHPDQVLSREQLLSMVWGYDFDPGSNVVEVYVRYLRRKLGDDVVETVRGMGYRMPA